MDILNKIFEINDILLLNNIAEEIYTIESDDEEEDIEDIKERIRHYVKRLDKINNRQFKLNNKRYYINEYDSSFK